jgi:hypothetical protein
MKHAINNENTPYSLTNQPNLPPTGKSFADFHTFAISIKTGNNLKNY